MDDRRFDTLAKSLGTLQSRRSALKGALGVGWAVIAGKTLQPRESSAARRPTPTPKPPTCPLLQTYIDGKCVCSDPLDVTCGPECCPRHITECCDNACCFGTCYDEELCCLPGEVGYNGSCCTPKSCADLWPDYLLSCTTGIDDGCGGTIFCGCPEGWECSGGGSGTCLNMTTTCIADFSVCGLYPQLAQCVGGGGYACSPDIDGTNTCATHELGFCGGTCTSDAECESGYVCAQACDQFCDNYGCLQLPPT
ncbi:MAG: hypothetical protein R2848_05190 [Thermomicrobiales bacterium]